MLAKPVSRDLKGKVSPVMCVAGILTAWLVPAWIGMAFFVFVALMVGPRPANRTSHGTFSLRSTTSQLTSVPSCVIATD